MRRVRFVTAAFAVFSVIAVASPVRAAPRKRSIEMEITLPNGGAPRVVVPDGEGAIIRLPNRSRFGFVPTIRDDEEAPVIVVVIWDVDTVPNRRLGAVEVMTGGPAVMSDTTPRFGVRIARVIKPK
jgi:hypothetical protein